MVFSSQLRQFPHVIIALDKYTGYMFTSSPNCMSNSHHQYAYTRDVFYVRRKVDLIKTAKVNTYIMHIFGKIGLLYIHAI